MDDALLAELSKLVHGKYYGKYRGFVADNKDPKHLGRVRLVVPSVLGKEVSGWALPCAPFGGLKGQGWFAIPEVRAAVWVEFEEGDLHHPIWTGTFWADESDALDAAARDEPTTRALATPSGHLIQLEDEKDKGRIVIHHAGGAELLVDEKGTVRVTDQKGATVVLDADNAEVRVEDSHGNTLLMTSSGTTVEDSQGNKIEMASAGVTIKGNQIVLEGTKVMLGGQGGEPIIKGQSFLALFASHVHTASPGGGPTSPPIPQGESSALSTAVTTK
jgi:hypothetical protein